jgi:pimeloyl-ACP methyl ester carboxylesterase
MPFADASGVSIHYALAGSGPPLVLLQGWVGDLTTWRHAGYVDALAGQFTLVLVDGRGLVAAASHTTPPCTPPST